MTHDTDETTEAERLRTGLQTALSSPPEPVTIHDIIRRDGERELDRSVSALAAARDACSPRLRAG